MALCRALAPSTHTSAAAAQERRAELSAAYDQRLHALQAQRVAAAAELVAVAHRPPPAAALGAALVSGGTSDPAGAAPPLSAEAALRHASTLASGLATGLVSPWVADAVAEWSAADVCGSDTSRDVRACLRTVCQGVHRVLWAIVNYGSREDMAAAFNSGSASADPLLPPPAAALYPLHAGAAAEAAAAAAAAVASHAAASGTAFSTATAAAAAPSSTVPSPAPSPPATPSGTPAAAAAAAAPLLSVSAVDAGGPNGLGPCAHGAVLSEAELRLAADYLRWGTEVAVAAYAHGPGVPSVTTAQARTEALDQLTQVRS